MEQDMREVYASHDEAERMVAALTAYHEAGHAVAAFDAGIGVHEATTVGRSKNASASVLTRIAEAETKEETMKLLFSAPAVSLAGMAAERLYAEQEGLYEEYGEALEKHIKGGGRSDRKAAREELAIIFGDELSRSEVKEWLEIFETMTRNTLREHWETVETIASALLKEYRLDRTRLAELMEVA